MLGLGHIGRHLLKLLAPFNTGVYVYDPYVPPELGEILNVTLTSLDQVLALSDVVVCLVPITPRTEGMLGAREFSLMKDGAVFVNVSRGKIVDTNALVERARSGKLIACLDVTDPEPLPPESPLLKMPTVILSPHIASAVAGGLARSLSLMLDELARHFAGHETWFTIHSRTLANRTGRPAPTGGDR
jgi:phosphoglycerate dehydrogenase-like enzyme